MKTLSLIILITILFVCIGCDIEPFEFDHKSDGWTLFLSGIIDKTYLDASSGKKVFLIKFKNGATIKVNRFHNFNAIKEQDKGSVYRWKGDLRKRHYYYMWVPDDDISTDIPIIDKKEIIKISTTIVEFIKYEWENAKAKQPLFYQTVLVKFENDIVTTAYYTQAKVWKAEIDRNKLSGGIALKNIVQWKLVDLK